MNSHFYWELLTPKQSKYKSLTQFIFIQTPLYVFRNYNIFLWIIYLIMIIVVLSLISSNWKLIFHYIITEYWFGIYIYQLYYTSKQTFEIKQSIWKYYKYVYSTKWKRIASSIILWLPKLMETLHSAKKTIRLPRKNTHISCRPLRAWYHTESILSPTGNESWRKNGTHWTTNQHLLQLMSNIYHWRKL